MPATPLAWALCETAPGAWPQPPTATEASAVPWVPATVPGTAAQALHAADRYDPQHPRPLHGSDIWYRCHLSGQGEHLLQCDGLATLAEVYLDGTRLAHTTSMFQPLAVALPLAGDHTLYLAFRSLDAHLRQLKLPRARWRVAMVAEQALRGVRTTLLGHLPSWCPDIHTVGPWRPVRLLAPDDLTQVTLQASLNGHDTGCLEVTLRCTHDLGHAQVSCHGQMATLQAREPGVWQARLHLPQVQRWWPAGHGAQVRYPVALLASGATTPLGQVGFRQVAVDRGADGRGFALVVNGQRVFARGAVFTPPDMLQPGADGGVAERLRQLADMGANMVRVAGPFCYQGPAFFEACDALGLMVWQDLMLANFDYPLADPAFLAQLVQEVQAQLRPLAGHPSLVVVCGGSEVQQQAAMLGLPAHHQRFDFFNTQLPALCDSLCPSVVVVANSPTGGDLPFSVREGVSHYFGVGAYERPLEDARRAAPRFVTECLAFSQVPEPCSLEQLGVPAVHHPAWKTGVPRDRHATWDFEDTRDHYLQRVFGLDPLALRRTDAARYLQASRAVTAHVLSTTLSEWRRPGSPTAGALVFTAGDLQPGAGWGLIAVDGEPKAAYHGFKQVAQPLALLLTDEGCDGLDIHVVNDTPDAVQLAVQVRLLRTGSVVVAQGSHTVTVPGRGGLSLPATQVLGAFLDLTYAFRFGPPGHDAVVVTASPATPADGTADTAPTPPLQAVFFPLGPCSPPMPLGLQAHVECVQGQWWLVLTTATLARFVHIDDRTHRPSDNHFHLLPGAPRRVHLVPRGSGHGGPQGEVTALNGSETVHYQAPTP